ncbi:MAG: hypothetical protein AAF571_14695, partial [Verrucomicrobiota bacterium]
SLLVTSWLLTSYPHSLMFTQPILCEVKKAITTLENIPDDRIRNKTAFILATAKKALESGSVPDRRAVMAEFAAKREKTETWRESVAEKTGSDCPENPFEAFRKVMAAQHPQTA